MSGKVAGDEAGESEAFHHCASSTAAPTHASGLLTLDRTRDALHLEQRKHVAGCPLVIAKACGGRQARRKSNAARMTHLDEEGLRRIMREPGLQYHSKAQEPEGEAGEETEGYYPKAPV